MRQRCRTSHYTRIANHKTPTCYLQTQQITDLQSLQPNSLPWNLHLSAFHNVCIVLWICSALSFWQQLSLVVAVNIFFYWFKVYLFYYDPETASTRMILICIIILLWEKVNVTMCYYSYIPVGAVWMENISKKMLSGLKLLSRLSVDFP